MSDDGTITPTLFVGTLSIDGTLMHCPAWDLPDIGELWLGPAVRGEDRVIAGRTGVLAYPRRGTVTTRSLRMIVSGVVDRNGDPWSDLGDITDECQRHQIGLQRNIAYLRANVTDPTNVGDGTRTAVLTLPDPAEDPVTAPVHVLGMTPGAKLGPVQRFTLELSFPLGALVP